MFWQEESSTAPQVAPDDIVDLAFRIQCRCLPVEHAYALSKALIAALPWLDEEEDAGIHTIHVAESGNGWIRPGDSAGEVLYLSKRTRLNLRLPRTRIDQAAALTGKTLDIDGYPMVVEKASVRPLSTLSTLFSRYVVGDPDPSEEEFIASLAVQFDALEIRLRKLLCGKPHAIVTPDEKLFTRSVMVADLNVEESAKLQKKGIGPRRKMGCGLFIPHKGIAPVKQTDE